MKIGIFTDCYKPIINGVVTSIEITVEGLQAQGCDTYIFAPQVPGYIPSDDSLYCFHSFVFPFQREERMAIPIPWNYFRLIGQLELDVFHIHTPFFVGLMGAYWAKRLNKPMIFTYHTLFEEYVHYIPLPQGFLKRVARWWSCYTSNKCQRIIAPSEKVKKVLQVYGINTPIDVIPTPVDAATFSSGLPEKVLKRLSLDPKDKLLVFVGRMGKEKGIDFLLRAFHQIIKELPDVKLLLIGDGPEKKTFQRLAVELGISEHTLFTGYVPRQELKDYFSASVLFLFSSLTETQGMVLLEAMASGLPVVAVREEAFMGIIEDGKNGVFTEPDIKDFARKVVALICNGQRIKEMGEKARKDAARFLPQRIIPQLLKVYSEVSGKYE